jgi:hypothetical protein
MILHHHLAVKGVRTREQALEDFYRYHDAHNGTRRTSPREFIKVNQARSNGQGAWDIYYSVPSRILRS